MGILALLAAFTQGAATTSGAQFAVTYAAFLAVIAWLFQTVRRFDTPESARVTGMYALTLFVSAVAIAGSALLPTTDLRLIVWGAFAVVWITATLLLGFRSRSFSLGVTPTDSMVERINVFTIIVLGEVVVGVVGGLTGAHADMLAVVTGMLALSVGLGFWWIYFDIVGGRHPKADGRNLTTWLLTHLPLTGAIAASGAGMVSLIEHAADTVAPQGPAWLIAISTALVLVSEVVNARTLEGNERLARVYKPLSLAMLVAAALAVAVGLVQPPPWLLTLGLATILLVTWLFAVSKFMRVSAWPPSRSMEARAGAEATD
jgi:low temperature requirement protein LtrA